MNPQRQIHFTGRCVTSLCMALIVSGILLSPGKGMAGNYPLANGAASATLNLGPASGGTGNLGMNNWNLGTGNQLNQQWFWYAIGGAAPTSIDQLPGAVLNTSYSGANNLTVSYVNSQVSINVDYVLQGVDPQNADMMEYIWIDNVSGSPVNFTFYQYSNFNLLGNNNNTVNISGSPGAYTAAYQTSGGPGTGIAEVLVAPSANDAEAAVTPQTLGELGGSSYLTLDDHTSATGNVSWAFQWTATIGAGGELDISKDLGLEVMPVPEPSTLALIALGMGALGSTLRRKLS
jgi:hypothetical protein